MQIQPSVLQMQRQFTAHANAVGDLLVMGLFVAQRVRHKALFEFDRYNWVVYVDFGDKDAVVGSNITLQFDTACLGVFLRFSPSFQWYHNGFALLINASSYTSYRLENSTTLVIENIDKRHLGQYILRFSVGVYGPYEVKARVDLLQTGGRCSKLLVIFT